MKTSLILIVALIATNPTVVAQPIEVSVLGGYQFGGSLSTTTTRLKIRSGPNMAVRVDVPLRQDFDLELYYLRQFSTLDSEQSLGNPEELWKLGVNYFQAGAIYELNDQGALRPFGSITAGATWFDPLEEGWSATTMFSWTAGIGLRAPLSRRFGLRIQGSLLMPLKLSTGGIFCRAGDCAIGLSSGTSIIQGEVSGGLTMYFER
jgi:hypothetical protein